MNTNDEGVTAAYLPLYELLRLSPPEPVTLSISEIENALGFKLPAKAFSDDTWWRSTPRNSWARSWLRADRRASLDTAKTRVSFNMEVYVPALDEIQIDGMHRRELEYARNELEHAPGAEHVELRWWEPHIVYVLHVGAEGLYKVGHTRHDSRRLRELTARNRAEIIQTVKLANLWSAKMVEGTVLVQTASARKTADRFDARNGQTEHWDDSVAPPDLERIADELSVDPDLRSWAASEFRPCQDR
jgi:hypothetical protein